jgi:tetratricopeptide (TPR) repeat protein
MPRSTTNFDTVRKIGLALPGVEESTAYGAPALKVHGKLLACVPTRRSAEPGSLAVRVGFDDRAELLAADLASPRSRVGVEFEPTGLHPPLIHEGQTVRYFTCLVVVLCISASALYAAAQNSQQLRTSEKQQVSKEGTNNPEAYELYLKGRSYWAKRTRADLETAVSYFNQAIAKDPGYAMAYTGLADAYAVLPDYGGITSEDIPKANAAARKALELDATLGRPHAVLGYNKVMHEWDFAGGEAEFKKAVALDPDDATAHQWYAECIGETGGREQEALSENNRAHQLDPLSPIISYDLGRNRILARQYDEAIAVCKKVAIENPTFTMAHYCLSVAYWGKRMYSQSIEEFKVASQLSGDRNESELASAMEQGFRSGGWKGAYRKGIEVSLAQRKTGYSSAYTIATMYAELGEKDQAFQWLNTAFQEHDEDLLGLRTDSSFDPIRSDPRFAELVRKVGLPQ